MRAPSWKKEKTNEISSHLSYAYGMVGRFTVANRSFRYIQEDKNTQATEKKGRKGKTTVRVQRSYLPTFYLYCTIRRVGYIEILLSKRVETPDWLRL